MQSSVIIIHRERNQYYTILCCFISMEFPRILPQLYVSADHPHGLTPPHNLTAANRSSPFSSYTSHQTRPLAHTWHVLHSQWTCYTLMGTHSSWDSLLDAQNSLFICESLHSFFFHCINLIILKIYITVTVVALYYDDNCNHVYFNDQKAFHS